MASTSLPTDKAVTSSSWRDRGRPDVLLWEVLRVGSDSPLLLKIIATNSHLEQGVFLSSRGGIVVNGTHYKSVVLRQSTAPQTTTILCVGPVYELHMYNVWFRDGQMNSQSHSSGMLKSAPPGGFRYDCNDIGFSGQFDSISFSVTAAA